MKRDSNQVEWKIETHILRDEGSLNAGPARETSGSKKNVVKSYGVSSLFIRKMSVDIEFVFCRL